MVIDCDRCEIRAEDACRDCVVTALLGAPPAVVRDQPERDAITALAAAGMLPRLTVIPSEKSA